MKNRKEVIFKIPEVGHFKISTNIWKYTPPFSFYTEQERVEHKRKQDEMKAYVISYDGCGIGDVDKIEDGYIIIEDYANKCLQRRKSEHEYALVKINKVLETTKKMPIDRIRFVSLDEKKIICSDCCNTIETGELINEFEYESGKIDNYCMTCLAERTNKFYVWERKDKS
jgi:hypothetical protein